MKKVIIIISVIFCIIIGLIIELFVLGIGKTTEQDSTHLKYTNIKFGYSFTFPKTWESAYPKITYFFNQGLMTIKPKNNSETQISFHYSDSDEISNIDELYSFVEDDMKWEEENRNSKVISIKKTNLNNSVLCKFETMVDFKKYYFEQYYFADYTEDAVIWVYRVSVRKINPEDTTYSKEIKEILNSFQIIGY